MRTLLGRLGLRLLGLVGIHWSQHRHERSSVQQLDGCLWVRQPLETEVLVSSAPALLCGRVRRRGRPGVVFKKLNWWVSQEKRRGLVVGHGS